MSLSQSESTILHESIIYIIDNQRMGYQNCTRLMMKLFFTILFPIYIEKYFILSNAPLLLDLDQKEFDYRYSYNQNCQ